MAGEYREVEVGGRTVKVSSPGKVYFPERGFTKWDVVSYHLAVGDGAAQIAGPAISTLVLAASWALRPPSRRLAAG